ncbi:glycoside hydrolase family 2 protein [Chitinophaga tropicalis]|nr:sugar-binding domain-containing protein [Chitinophaga tropicalis]
MRYVLAALVTLCAAQGQLHAQSTATSWKMKEVPIQTRWAKEVSPTNVLPDYPRPQMVRGNWVNLNGLWEYKITDKDAPAPSIYEGQILVPFPLESALSGVQRPLKPTQRLWYKRSITKPDTKGDKRVLLHFGAVDWQATVFVNGKEIGQHSGGYQNFSFDITDALKPGSNELVVSVFDPTDEGSNPHGKQVLHPGNIMYTASSGIWQTVWLETVPTVHINNLRITPDIDKGNLRLEVLTSNGDYTIEAIASNGKKVKGNANTELLLPVPNAHLWSPDDPYLYNLSIRLLHKGKVIDTIGSYFGMRKIEVKKDEKSIDRLFLNNKYTYHLGVLDQGFWPEGLYTAPTDEALKFDIIAIRNMGYNTIRKHIKLEPARWYYHADKTGVLVWQDMVTCANGTPEAQAQFEKENKENIAQLYNYPSIVIWVLFNEGWARYDQKRLTEWMKHTDPSRIVNGHTGENYDRGTQAADKWVSSDLTDVHVYPGPGIPPTIAGKALVLGEWGGVRVPTLRHQWNDTEGWGYVQVAPGAFKPKYDSMVKALKVFETQGLSGSIYTEPFDVETEENGMITYDREVIKVAPEDLRKIHRQLLQQALNYAAAPSAFSARVADTANPDLQYTSLLQQFEKGKKEPEFLRELSLMAARLKDSKNATKVSAAYINELSNPFTLKNLNFINRFTQTTKDPGFNIFLKNQGKVDAILGDNSAINKVKGIIFNSEIREYVTGSEANPDWINIEKAVVPKYGAAGEAIFLRAKTIHHLNHKEWQNFVTAATLLIDKYEKDVSEVDLNNYAWFIFENISDTNSLNKALHWSRMSLDIKMTPSTIDTYANILYKLGQKDKAIEWEQKAIELDPGASGFKQTLEKMKKGEKTWN